MELKSFIRDVPDFPIPGILFRDITPLLQNAVAFRQTIDKVAGHYEDADFDVIVGIESRGFLFGAPIAYKMGKPFVPIRKPGKLPSATHTADYALEYGNSTVEIHMDGIIPGQKVLLTDDLLATGGTLEASARLVETSGGVVAGIAVIVELTELDGRSRLGGHDIFSLLQY